MKPRQSFLQVRVGVGVQWFGRHALKFSFANSHPASSSLESSRLTGAFGCLVARYAGPASSSLESSRLTATQQRLHDVVIDRLKLAGIITTDSHAATPA